jgi:hypothetical protein
MLIISFAPVGAVETCLTDALYIHTGFLICQAFWLDNYATLFYYKRMDNPTWKTQKQTLREQVQIRILPELRARVEAAAAAHYNGNVSDLIRHAIEERLEALNEHTTSD